MHEYKYVIENYIILCVFRWCFYTKLQQQTKKIAINKVNIPCENKLFDKIIFRSLHKTATQIVAK